MSVLISLITISWGEFTWDATSESNLVLIKCIILWRWQLSKFDVKSKLNGVSIFFKWKLAIQTDGEYFFSQVFQNYKWMDQKL